MMEFPHAIILLLSLCLLTSTNAFQITKPFRTFLQESRLMSTVIRPDAEDFEFDPGRGGVELAEESVLKVTGTVKHGPGSANPKVSELKRYFSVENIQEKTVNEILKGTIVCTGRGTEMYKNPGETVEAEVTLAPHDAVLDALMGAGSAMEADRLVVNFVGGNDAQFVEVLDAVKTIVLDLDVPTKAKISFNSLSHSSFPAGSSALTVVALPEDASTGGLQGVERAIASGEIYFCDGKYYTVTEEATNSATT